MPRLVLCSTAPVHRRARIPGALDRTKVTIDVIIDGHELDRRKQCSASSILNLDLLNILLTMPLGSAVPADRFSEYEWRRLEAGTRTRATSIHRVNRQLCATRHAKPPLDVKHTTVTARDWRAGISVASRFAPYSSREVLLTRLPEDDLDLRLEADYLGVGVSVCDSSSDIPHRQVIEPAQFTPDRFTGASWLFAERLLNQHSLLDG